MSNNTRKFVQLNLDKSKPKEKKIAEYIENKCSTEKIKNKSLLIQALQEKMDREKVETTNLTKESKLNEDITEIKSMMKLMIQCLANNTKINITTNTEKNNENEDSGLKVSKMEIVEIDEDELDI